MQGKMGLEEQFAIEQALLHSAGFVSDRDWPPLRDRLLDRNGRRLKEMDSHGMELMIISLNAPAIQASTNTARAVDLARPANDALVDMVAARPDRFRTFAALPLQDPEAAARELERCVRDLGFVGAR
jgi:gamma-resorcylate decarboxylase